MKVIIKKPSQSPSVTAPPKGEPSESNNQAIEKTLWRGSARRFSREEAAPVGTLGLKRNAGRKVAFSHLS